ncbi:Potassium channel [Coemansia sp. RSA 922]|nr:Potassium channel [Coemansia sp. RSA 922]
MQDPREPDFSSSRDLERNASGSSNADQSATEDSEEHEYDGDENEGSSDDTGSDSQDASDEGDTDEDDGSPEEAWNPVVTFAESRTTNSPSRLAGVTSVADRLNRSPSISSQHGHSHHHRRARPLRMQLGQPHTTRSNPALERLRLDLQNTLESVPGPPPPNTHSGAIPEAARSREASGSFSPRSGSLQPDELAMPPLSNIAAHWRATASNYDTAHPADSHDRRHTNPRWDYESSDDESTQAISRLAGVDMSVIDTGRPLRGRTMSAHAPLDQLSASPDDVFGSTDRIHHLPRVATMTSAKEKNGGDMETGLDDLPPMRLGREITNDLRNIQLTFSNQPPAREHSANPLKHLIRSRHNFRALVTYGGYLFPINILLNVILLGRGWLEFGVPDENGKRPTVDNPMGYLVTSVISLALIVCSGVCFILRCVEFDVVITTMTSIVANFVNAVLILAIAIMYMKIERPKHPEARLTGEYYCSYAGAMVALINALLLLLDVLITPGFRYRGSGMSRQQRLLQFNIIIVVVWIGIGGYAWSKIENWDTISSVMFCMVSITTIGFGNKSPTKTYSRVLQLFYGPLGILMFGLMLLHTRNVIIQITKSKFSQAKRGLEARRKRIEQDATISHVKRRLAARPEQRSWHSVVTEFLSRVFLPHERRARIGIPHWLRKKLEEEDDEKDESQTRHSDNEPSDRRHSKLPDRHSGLEEGGGGSRQSVALPDMSADDTRHTDMVVGDNAGVHSSRAHQAPFPMARSYTTASRLSQIREAISRPGLMGRIRRRVGTDGRRRASDDKGSDGDLNIGSDEEDDDNVQGTGGVLEVQASRGSRKTSRQINREASRASGVSSKSGGRGKLKGKGKKRGGIRDITKQLWVALFINICFWLASAAIFYAFERKHWTYFDAMYFCYVAFTTIGYGDVVPTTTEGELAFICLCFVAVGLETFLVVSAVSYFSDLLGRLMRRTKVQGRIEKRRRSLVAYEIRRHIKHPNYNPFSQGEDDRLMQEGITSLKRAVTNVGKFFRGQKSLKSVFKRRRADDQQRQRDETLTEVFVRQATGMGGFRAAEWQPPSPHASLASAVSLPSVLGELPPVVNVQVRDSLPPELAGGSSGTLPPHTS